MMEIWPSKHWLLFAHQTRETFFGLPCIYSVHCNNKNKRGLFGHYGRRRQLIVLWWPVTDHKIIFILNPDHHFIYFHFSFREKLSFKKKETMSPLLARRGTGFVPGSGSPSSPIKLLKSKQRSVTTSSVTSGHSGALYGVSPPNSWRRDSGSR